MIPDFKTFINESIWSDLQDRSSGEVTRKEDDINNLDFEEFVNYLKDTYEVTIQPDFFQIGSWYIGGGNGVGNISIPIEKNNSDETPNLSNRMLMLKKDIQKDNFEIKPNKYVFRLYPSELRKTFGDKYDLDAENFEIIPKDGIINNQVCVDVIDKLIGMVENPILIKK